MKIMTASAIQDIEKRASRQGVPLLTLMENAGVAAVRVVERYNVFGKRVCIVCGNGNNGGDGLVMARYLYRMGAYVTVLLALGGPKTREAVHMFERLDKTRIQILELTDKTDLQANDSLIRTADIVVDALFGIGFHGQPNGAAQKIIYEINYSKAVVVAVDIPSGLTADSGSMNGTAVKADVTVTFSTYKPAHVVFPAAAHCGKLILADVGVPQYIIKTIESDIKGISDSMIPTAFPPRDTQANKGDFGKLLCVCGSEDMPGAALLAVKSAVKSGAGIVNLAAQNSVCQAVSHQLAEPLYTSLGNGAELDTAQNSLCRAISVSTACLIGPGLGKTPFAQKMLTTVLENANCPVIIDADGINLLSGNINILERDCSKLIITPHPGEMARLCNTTVSQIQRCRIEYAKEIAMRFSVTVVLKGANTIIACRDGKVYINTNGNAGMAKGGSGDVLAGMIASFAAQGMDTALAAVIGVYLHGAAGDRAAAKHSMQVMTPSDIIEEIGALFLELNR